MTDAAEQRALADLVARYCDAVARADPQAFGACWTADANWSGPGLDRHGVDDIVAAFTATRARFAFAVQWLGSGRVAVHGATATGSWWIREVLAGHDGRTRHTTGRYDDEYARTPDGWRFARRRFTPAGPPS